ncbi:Multifunctional methyltransferase subunit TRM112-like protein [Liparis tanakae]|uniref:Multifunctional methyltransferase subunit TRM112-like protein n=1 Tax=Liparis tanakae TaxID=230148 RepID=A0A4Z2FYQ3_9TELE|nr:Multifunctional methyltransferase subunit TRM112-like protein [Liparis tanakae]
MKLLTHNMLTSHVKGVTKGYPLLIKLGQRQDLPGELLPEYENNEEFLKKVHRVLLEVSS